jgi:hypothetical protein
VSRPRETALCASPKTPRATTYVVLPPCNDIFWQWLEKEDKKYLKLLALSGEKDYFCRPEPEGDEGVKPEAIVSLEI